MAKANWIGPRPSPTAALLRRKKGGLYRENQTWQGHEVDGGGRRPRYSSGKPAGLSVPGRSKAAGADPGHIAVPRHGPGRPRQHPERVIYDKACDSDALRKRLAKRGIELICPHRKNRVKPPLQDGRKLRRYKRRWKVERTFAWLGNFRRLVVRWEHHITMYRAFFHVACLLITLRQL
jgi:transposase